MLHPSTKRLIDRLCEMTTQRKIDWAIGEHPDTLVYDTEGYRVLLEGEPAELVLRDALGKELERASQDILAQSKHIDGGTYAELVATMHEEASRIARGTEDAIASVLGGMSLDDNPGDDSTLIPEETPVEADEPFSTPIADAVEDNADEMSAIGADNFTADSEAFEDASLTEPNNTNAYDEPPVLDVADESVPETVLEASITEAPETRGTATQDADHVMSTPMPATDEIVDAADLDISSEQAPAFEQTPYEETPDVGKAVADLANQVNEGAPAEAQFEAPKDPVPPRRDESAMRASTISNFATSSLGMPTGGMGSGAVISGPATKPAEKTAQEPVREATPIAEPEAPLAPVAPTQETRDSVWKPGQTLSLSGLAPDDAEDIPITPEPSQPASSSFTASPSHTPVPPAMPQAALDESVAAPAQDTASEVTATPTPPPAAEETVAAPDASLEETTEEEASGEQAPKRFNPWV